jgi:hypothetical protein
MYNLVPRFSKILVPQHGNNAGARETIDKMHVFSITCMLQEAEIRGGGRIEV